MRTIDDSTSTIKGHYRVSNRLNADDFALFTITGSITESTGYFQVPSSYISGSTSLVTVKTLSSLLLELVIKVTLVPPVLPVPLVIKVFRCQGAKVTGPTGPQGNQGVQVLQVLVVLAVNRSYRSSRCSRCTRSKGVQVQGDDGLLVPLDLKVMMVLMVLQDLLKVLRVYRCSRIYLYQV